MFRILLRLSIVYVYIENCVTRHQYQEADRLAQEMIDEICQDISENIYHISYKGLSDFIIKIEGYDDQEIMNFLVKINAHINEDCVDNIEDVFVLLKELVHYIIQKYGDIFE